MDIHTHTHIHLLHFYLKDYAKLLLWESSVRANTAWALGADIYLSAAGSNFFSCLSLYPILNANRTHAFDNVISAVNSNIYGGIASIDKHWEFSILILHPTNFCRMDSTHVVNLVELPLGGPWTADIPMWAFQVTSTLLGVYILENHSFCNSSKKWMQKYFLSVRKNLIREKATSGRKAHLSNFLKGVL